MSALTAVILSQDLIHIVAQFDTPMDPATLTGGANWTLSSATAGAMPAVVTNAIVLPNAMYVSLICGATLSAGVTYTLRAPNAKTSLGAALVPPNDQVDFAAPAVNGNTAEWPGRILEAMTRGLGEELQVLSGHAVTLLVDDFEEDATVAFVETTLGFPAAGGLYVGQRRYTYAAKTDCSFTGCQKTREWDGTAVSAWTTVTYDANSWLPVE